jgi:hypothetical protein
MTAKKPTARTQAEHDANLEQGLRRLQEVLLRHPLAVQAAFSALVAEGRTFAKTAEGAELRDRLARSSRFGKARMVWEVLTMSGFTERPQGALPGVFVDALARAMVSDRLEPLLSRIFEKRL